MRTNIEEKGKRKNNLSYMMKHLTIRRMEGWTNRHSYKSEPQFHTWWCPFDLQRQLRWPKEEEERRKKKKEEWFSYMKKHLTIIRMEGSSLVKNWATAPHLVVTFWPIMPQTKPQHFFSALWPLPPARYHRSRLPYAILANSDDFLSRKTQKTSFSAHFRPFLPKFGPPHLFSRIGLNHFSPLHGP